MHNRAWRPLAWAGRNDGVLIVEIILTDWKIDRYWRSRKVRSVHYNIVSRVSTRTWYRMYGLSVIAIDDSHNSELDNCHCTLISDGDHETQKSMDVLQQGVNPLLRNRITATRQKRALPQGTDARSCNSSFDQILSEDRTCVQEALRLASLLKTCARKGLM